MGRQNGFVPALCRFLENLAQRFFVQRNKKILLLSHCILNANAKIKRIALYPGALQSLVIPLIEHGYGFLQLPCPELLCHGIARWGQVKEQYDTPYFKKHCHTILEPILNQVLDYRAHGYEIVGCVGVDGSPNCGINLTCKGDWGGEMDNNFNLEQTLKSLHVSQESGVFMDVFKELLEQKSINLAFYAIDESNPTVSVENILKELL